jgi:acyl-CoA synthetase (AMP-forming)/AMP-acid ligase II
MNALSAFQAHARKRPQQPALLQGVGPGRSVLSFGALEQRSAQLAQGLLAQGLKRGDRVLVAVPMSQDLYTILLACFRCGLSAVFVDAWADLARLDAALAAASPQAVFLSPRACSLLLLSAGLRRVPRRYPVQKQFFPLARLFAPSASSALPSLPQSQEAYVTFTTGSTGKPKGAARSHGFLAAQSRALAKVLRPRAGSVDLAVLPSFVLLNLAQGVSSVLPEMDPAHPERADPARQWALILEHRVQSASGSPAYFDALAAHALGLGQRLPFKRLFVGGAAVPPAMAQRLVQACEGEVTVVYGSTEAEPIAHTPARALLRAAKQGKPGLLAGKPEGVALKILRPADGPLALGRGGWVKLRAKPGQAGEIVVSGPHVQRGYLGDPAGEAQNKIKDGSKVWHRSGDAGYLDAQGRLFLLGRLQQRVERKGRVWWSLEAERRALQVPGVAFAAYFGLSDPGLGQRAVLCVESAAPAAALEAALRQALAPYPVDRFKVLPRLPKDPRHGSKIDLEALKALL